MVPSSRFVAVGNHQQRVRVEQRRDLRLVSLELVERLADGGLFIRDVFEFQHRQRDAVDEHHHIRAPVEMAFLHRELIDGEKFVGFGIRKINQPDLVVNDLTVALRNSTSTPSTSSR